MELPAQAVKSKLYGVHPPSGPGGSGRMDGNQSQEIEYPEDLEGNLAVAFFVDWRAGPVGRIAEQSPPELVVTL